jgi:hypothetical protein
MNLVWMSLLNYVVLSMPFEPCDAVTPFEPCNVGIMNYLSTKIYAVKIYGDVSE